MPKQGSIEVVIMIVPGKSARVSLPPNSTVLDACAAAEKAVPGAGWAEIAKSWQVRMNGMIMSNAENYLESQFAGDIKTTPLPDGATILLMTKVRGNAGRDCGVITCTVNGETIALEGPTSILRVLELSGCLASADKIDWARANGQEVDRSYVVKDKDVITYSLKEAARTVNFNGSNVTFAQPEDDDDDGVPSVEIDGVKYDTKEGALEAILDSELDTELDEDVFQIIRKILNINSDEDKLEIIGSIVNL